MWPFNRVWPLNGGPLNGGSTVRKIFTNFGFWAAMLYKWQMYNLCTMKYWDDFWSENTCLVPRRLVIERALCRQFTWRTALRRECARDYGICVLHNLPSTSHRPLRTHAATEYTSCKLSTYCAFYYQAPGDEAVRIQQARADGNTQQAQATKIYLIFEFSHFFQIPLSKSTKFHSPRVYLPQILIHSHFYRSIVSWLMNAVPFCLESHFTK